MIQLFDRVSRPIYLDDGTWMELGDSCLPGPLKHGTVIEVRHHFNNNRLDTTYQVKWDDGKYSDGYFAEGLKRED